MRQIQKGLLTTLQAMRPKPKVILDVGCGKGYFTRAIASALPYAHISAIDPDASAFPQDTRHITYRKSAVETLPYEDDSFDVVVACMSFHHWNSKQEGVQEAFRTLRTEGVLLIGDPFFEGIMRNRFMAWLLQKTDGGTFTAFDELESFLSVAGFGVMQARPVASSFGTMFVVSAQKQKSREKRPPGFAGFGRKAVQHLCKDRDILFKGSMRGNRYR